MTNEVRARPHKESELLEIPRRRSSNGSERGPLLIPPGAQHIPGNKKCGSCGRKVKSVKGSNYKGSCKCLYHRRTTTFIDVLQDEFLLKAWGKRNVAWGMAQRPDLVLHATTCKPDTDKEQPLEDKRELNDIARQAQETAEHMKKATIGTSLHKLTHQMDRGETLGFVPDPYGTDLKAYDEEMKRLGVQWVSIEQFRVLDEWVKDISECDHKQKQYGGDCECLGVAGTVDRIGWYKGRLRIFDIKTGSDFNKLGHAMQLAAYAHMVPYLFPGDTRGEDVDTLDLSVGHIIYLPEGEGECHVEAMDLEVGWRACQIAKLVWEARGWDAVVDRDVDLELAEMVSRAGTLAECRLLWRNAYGMGRLDTRLKQLITARTAELKAKGVSK